MYYEFWIALSNAKIEEIIDSTKSIKNKLLIGFVNYYMRNLIFSENMNWIISTTQVYIETKIKRKLFETMNKVNLNTFLLSAIKFGWEDNRSYKEKTKRSLINNKLNLLLLKWIIDKIYPQRYEKLNSFKYRKDIQEIKMIQYTEF